MRRLSAAGDGDAVVIDMPREDRERVSLGIAERAGMCALEPAPGGRLQVTFADAPDIGTGGGRLQGRSRPRLARLPRGRGVRLGLDARAGAARCSTTSAIARRARPTGRCCDVCDPGTLGLPDPASLTPARGAPQGARRDGARRARSTSRCWTR